MKIKDITSFLKRKIIIGFQVKRADFILDVEPGGKSNNFIIAANILVIVVFLLLPYYLFKGKLFIGGDDTRLFYIYPFEWLKNISFSSWFNFSTIGSYNPNFFSIPLLLVLSILDFLIPSKIILQYLFFSLPLILGFIYFQKFITELIIQNKKYKIEIFLGALIYTFSPILTIGVLTSFLYSAWLIALLPIILFYFLKYLKTTQFKYIFLNILWCTIFSLGLFSIPWFLGFAIPLAVGLFVSLIFFTKKNILYFLKRSLIFFGLLIISQAYWLIPFIYSFLGNNQSNMGVQILSKEVEDTFVPTVLATASGNIIYPLLNLFHRQIAFDFNGSLKEVFISFYDKTILFNIIFLVILFLGLFNFKKYFNHSEKRFFIIFLTAFLASMFFFTVNIGFLKEVFLLLGRIPGFVMFRNYFDKFALGYILIYSIVLTMSLIIINRRFENKKFVRVAILVGLTFVVVLNMLPIKEIINKPLWTTKNTYTSITIPEEYIHFMSKIKNKISPTSNILSIPFNIAAYTIIKEDNSNNVFAGKSPVQLFTGINDFSGNLSFPNDISKLFNKYIVERDYDSLKNLLRLYNVNYIFETKNIPIEVLNSYLFDKKVLEKQDQIFKDNIYGEIILTSENGNYNLYKLKYSKENQNASKINTPDSIYSLTNELDSDSLVPPFYVPQRIIYTDKTIENLSEIISLNKLPLRSAIYFNNQINNASKVLPVISENSEIPKITFTKINPTKYIIEIENAKEPYIIVFSESFHTGWKLYLNKATYNSLNNQKINTGEIDSYFNGDIKDGTHTMLFTGLDIFEKCGEKPIAENRHFIVNGYANSWYIVPEDVDGRKNYEIIIEFWPQRLFYIGSTISASTFLGCLCYLIYGLCMQKKRVKVKQVR